MTFKFVSTDHGKAIDFVRVVKRGEGLLLWRTADLSYTAAPPILTSAAVTDPPRWSHVLPEDVTPAEVAFERRVMLKTKEMNIRVRRLPPCKGGGMTHLSSKRPLRLCRVLEDIHKLPEGSVQWDWFSIGHGLGCCEFYTSNIKSLEELCNGT